MKYVFQETEQEQNEKLYQSWLHEEESTAFTQHFRELFIKLEGLMGEAMKNDPLDAHSKSERGWTPPPKGYADKFNDL